MKKFKLTVLHRFLVSVILPFYNAEATLARAIQSIIDQTYPSLELILIDNKSSDKSTIIAQDFAAKYQHVKLIQENRQGVTFASNKGAKESVGKYIARMDSDDYSYPERISRQVAYLEAHPEIGAVSGLVKYLAHHKNTKGFSRYVNWSNSIVSMQDIFLKRFVESPLVNPTLMWRKEIGIAHGLYRDGDFPEDYELLLRWISLGVKMEKLSEIVLDWHDSDQRLTRTSELYSNKAFYQIKSQYLSAFLHKNILSQKKIVVWGASRLSRRWVQILEKEDIEIDYYIDIKETRQISKKVVHFNNIPAPEEIFILVYQPQENLREEIGIFLKSRSYIEGKDFLFVA